MDKNQDNVYQLLLHNQFVNNTSIMHTNMSINNTSNLTPNISISNVVFINPMSKTIHAEKQKSMILNILLYI